MASTTAGESRCRRCGVDPLPPSAPYCGRLRKEQAEGIQAILLRLCEACSCEFASDEERDEYLRLGVLA